MKKLIFFFSFVLISALSLAAFAADIEGVVTDATGTPLPGANVFVKGTTAGAATDQNGKFSFKYDPTKEFVIIVRYMGYKTQSLTLKPGDDLSNLKFEMAEDVFLADEIVVTGIASERAKSVAEKAVSSLAADKLTVVNSYQDLSQMVTGKIAGVNIEKISGNVGGGIRFNVRSGGGLNGDEQPLIIVDGTRIDNSRFAGAGVGGQELGTLVDLNPEDIEKIEVLKGPAGAASYGTSGSNGVVLITTKKGKLVPGQPRGLSIDYKMVTGYNAQSYEYTEDDFLSYKSINDLFRDGKVQQQSLGLYGGSGIMKYYLGFDKRYEDGIIANNFMDRNTVRANLDVIPSQKFMISVSSGYTLNKTQLPNNDNNIFGFLGNTVLTPTPWQITDSLSVYGLTTKQKSNRLFGSAQVQYRPFQNFEASASIGIDDSDLRQDKLYPQNLVYSFYTSGDLTIWNRTNTQYTYNIDAKYTYSIISGLSVNSGIGAQLFDRKFKNFWIEKMDFKTELITNIGAAETFSTADDDYLHAREAGIYTNHSFSYLDQYYLTINLRQDYASAIGYDAPSIFYPGVSAAVRLDRYKFFPSMFDLMKIRAAYGESGVLPSRLDGIPLLWSAGVGGFGVGATLANIGNTKIEPERIKEFEVGFEAEMFTNYSVEFTYYNQRAVNSIIDFNNAPSTGKTASAVPFNIGESKGWGIESLFQARPISTRNFQLDISITNNYQTNEVTDLGGAQPIYDGFDLNVIKEGLPKHSFYTWKVLGANFDATGKYTGPIVTENDITDRATLDRFGFTDIDTLKASRFDYGTPIPTYNGSLSLNLNLFKNFNLYLLADWATGHKRFNMTKLFAIYYAGFFGGANNKEYRTLEEQLGVKDYDDMDITALAVGSDEYKAAADRYAKLDRHYDGNFIEDADYLKLREISISYSFKDLLPKMYGKTLITDLVLGLSANNLWTTTKYSGADVELNFTGSRSLTRGQDFLTLQQPRVYNVWLRISL
jgi:TonB-dependent SusC/RagA subfamily outer membrane receptor